MKIKTKMYIASAIMILVPLILGSIAVLTIADVFAQRGELTMDGIRLSGDHFIGVLWQPFVLDMLLAVFIILFLTSVLVTHWIRVSIYQPIKVLNQAMQSIQQGDFENRLPMREDDRSEVGELYQSYEDMRLRLKESTEEDLLREQQHKELISNISHDLKTPITSIKGYAEGLLEGVADTQEKRNKYLRTILNKANDMNTLINELTLYSSIDNNRVAYHFQKLSVAHYFGDCVEEVGMELDSRNIQLNYSNYTSQNTRIIADPEQLKRVINNIISNSVKYIGRENGAIDIRILDEVDAIRVEIEDNGIGIDPKDIPNIFDRFYRTDTSRTSSQGGSGIGLSIVKKIVEDHGGYIWATSHAGEGTCMHFVLRKYTEPDIQSVEQEKEEPKWRQKNKEKLWKSNTGL